MNPEVENLVLEELLDAVDGMRDIDDVVRYLNDRLQYNNEGLALEKTLKHMSNEDYITEEDLI